MCVTALDICIVLSGLSARPLSSSFASSVSSVSAGPNYVSFSASQHSRSEGRLNVQVHIMIIVFQDLGGKD